MDKDLLKMAVGLTSAQLNHNALATVTKDQISEQAVTTEDVMKVVCDYYDRLNNLNH